MLAESGEHRELVTLLKHVPGSAGIPAGTCLAPADAVVPLTPALSPRVNGEAM